MKTVQSAVLCAALVCVVLTVLGIWEAADAAPTDAAENGKKYFQYANVLKPGDYEFGYHQGNPIHYRAHYEQGVGGSNFRAKVKWGDINEGYGESLWEYNHGSAEDGKEIIAPAGVANE